MNRTVKCAQIGFLFLVFLVGFGVPRVQAQQPAVAEPQAPSGTVQTPPEVVPALPVPRLVKFAGTLKDGQGQPRTGVVGVTFAVYKEQEGGAALWLETQNVELDGQGRYTILLGSTKSEGLPLELFSTGEPRWLGVQVNLSHEVEQPRVLLVSVPYALKAADADTLGGKPLSAFLLAGSATPATASITTVGAPAGSAPTPAVATCTTPPCAVVTPGGTTGFLSNFSDATTIQNSPIFTSNGQVGIGTTNPQASLDVQLTTGAATNALNSMITLNNSSPITGSVLSAFKMTLLDQSTAPNLSKQPARFVYLRDAAATGGVTAFDSVMTATSFLSANAPYPLRGINIEGPTMATGTTLNSFTGLYVGSPGGAGTVTNKHALVTEPNAGNVGIGTTAPTAPLEVAGNLKVSGAGNAIIFPNGTVMSSAATGVGGGTITGVTAGSGLSGGGTVGGVTLAIDPAVVPQLGAGSNTFTGSVSASSFAGSGTALTNVNAAMLGGNPPGAFATTGGNIFTGNQTINGNVTATALTLPGLGTATAGGGFSSGAVSLAASSFNSGVGLPVTQTFQWQAQPLGNNTSNTSGQLSLFYGFGTNAPTPTGLSLASNGAITAPSLTGSGAGLTSVNAATLGGMAPSAFATVGTNTFTGNQSVTGNLNASGQFISTVATGTAPLSVSSSTLVPNLNSSMVGGLTATQLARVDAGNLFLGNQNVNGNISLSATLGLPNTNGSGTAGVITLGGTPFIHNFGTNNAFVGASAGNFTMTGTGNTAVGLHALSKVTNGSGNTAVGIATLINNSTGGSNTAVGLDALLANTAGSSNTAVGANALQSNTATGNTALGSNALNANTTGAGNTAVGSNALSANVTNGSNTAVGTGALQANTADGNAAFGFNTLNVNTTGSFNSAFGFNALAANVTATQNSAFGSGALGANTASNNDAFGFNALQANTTGSANSAFGSGALQANTTSNFNSAFGFGALQAYNVVVPGGPCCNTAVGYAALTANLTGGGNSAFGQAALGHLQSGDSNIAIGANAGNCLPSGSGNIYIGNCGPSAGFESNTIRIGSGCGVFCLVTTYIAGIWGSTSGSGTAVYVNSVGQLGTATSSRRFKEEIVDLGAESDLLLKLRPVAFYYKPELDDTHTRQYGLVAEEVAKVAPQLVVFDKDGAPQTVRYHFVNAMLLNEVQKQHRQIEEQQREIRRLRTEVANFRKTHQAMALLEARLARLESPQRPAPTEVSAQTTANRSHSPGATRAR